MISVMIGNYNIQIHALIANSRQHSLMMNNTLQLFINRGHFYCKARSTAVSRPGGCLKLSYQVKLSRNISIFTRRLSIAYCTAWVPCVARKTNFWLFFLNYRSLDVAPHAMGIKKYFSATNN